MYGGLSRLVDFWALALRLSTGLFWLFFASQRWLDISWARDLFTTAAVNNYLPVYGALLRTLMDSWYYVALFVTVAETAIGLMLVLGIFPRLAGGVGALIALTSC